MAQTVVVNRLVWNVRLSSRVLFECGPARNSDCCPKKVEMHEQVTGKVTDS